jgi:hypothetical protein
MDSNDYEPTSIPGKKVTRRDFLKVASSRRAHTHGRGDPFEDIEHAAEDARSGVTLKSVLVFD